ncbi:MAG: hypothetical protein ACP5QT_00570 [Brevinematia bacterium]
MAINIKNGNISWEKPLNMEIYHKPLHLSGKNLILAGKKELSLYDVSTGDLLKTIKMVYEVKNILVGNNEIYVLTENNLLYTLKSISLEKISEKKLDDKATIFMIDNSLFIVGRNFMIKN